MTASEKGPVDDVSVQETWRRLEADNGAVLVDVRTRAEWSFVGIADLSALGRKPVLVEWSDFPGGRVNADFAGELAAHLDTLGAGKETELFFICRSGVRSRNAANAMTAVGWKRCHNVVGGFEGPLDGEGHRGRKSGWKAEGLPWSQS